MTPYKTPGIYVEEISTFPPSIAEVETAIPAFIGYTEKALKNGVEDVTLKPTIIHSLLEYEEIFGGAPPIKITKAPLDAKQSILKTKIEVSFYTYYSLRMCFNNGGGTCYIISIADYDSKQPAKEHFLAGLKALEKQDKPTLILFPDAILLGQDMYDVQRQALKQCNDLQDRFALFDLLEPKIEEYNKEIIEWEKGVDEFRNNIGTNFLKYGAAYTPHLKIYLREKSSSELISLPPSGAIAGVYATVDKNRGVWKAPANFSLNSVSGVTEIIDSRAQESLNVDVVAGKSINAIRPFSGKGILVWGARTLAGNDNEWRYIPVRRFFNMVEESVKKSTNWAVFEPNDVNTWIKVRSMIENYLVQKWRDSALQGATPEEAFFVRVGLGVTMTTHDILDGRMNVEIGMAVVRPAEFIILKFSHKMPEA